MIRNYNEYITTGFKVLKKDLDAIEFDARAALENPNFKFSTDEKIVWNEYLKAIRDVLDKFEKVVKL